MNYHIRTLMIVLGEPPYTWTTEWYCDNFISDQCPWILDRNQICIYWKQFITV